MKAMLLAAGEGKRMRPLTLHTPKPLLPVAGKPLIAWHLQAVRAAGIDEVIINVAYLSEKIEAALGNGEQFGVGIRFSKEVEPLETAGGILQAYTHSLLGEDPILLVSGDVWTNYPLQLLVSRSLPDDSDGHLVLVDNPSHHPEGDFDIENEQCGFGLLKNRNGIGLTYSGIALIRPCAVVNCPGKRSKFPLREVFQHLISEKRVTAEYYSGDWVDVGTPERLRELERYLSGC